MSLTASSSLDAPDVPSTHSSSAVPIAIPESIWPNRPLGLPPTVWQLAPLIPAFLEWEKQGSMDHFMKKHGLTESLMDTRARCRADLKVVEELHAIILDIPQVKAIYDAVQKEHKESIEYNSNSQRDGLYTMFIAEGWGWTSDETDEDEEGDDDDDELIGDHPMQTTCSPS